MFVKKEDVIEDFTEYLKVEDININNISFEDVNDYLSLMYFDIFDNVDTIEDREAAEEEIEQIIYENFNVNMEE